ncbi:MAG: formate dehydrogenase accessory sulfurtransferase FdhD [Anaerolineales bacterium]|nr:formate dehydrogenase accessory sulfurtransferase FdhD [Anaerolineales bacterium]
MKLKDNHSQPDHAGVKPTRFISVGVGSPKHIEGEIVDEALACISVNGQELATFMCTPRDLDAMALGFLYNENLIKSLDEVTNLRVSDGRTCVDVWLHDTSLKLPKRMVLTAGCGGGVTFDDLSKIHEPLQSDLRATPQVLADLFRQMHLGADLYQRARGIHTAAIADQQEILLQVEDVGRHNCLDKLAGKALLKGLPTRDGIILSSGRISSEMINKARRLGTAIICSRTSPTSLSVALAESWNMTIVAYLRQERMRIYTHPERVLEDLPAGWEVNHPVDVEEIHSYD